MFAVVGAVEEFAVEQLDGDNGENEMEEHVHDEDVEDVLQRVDDAVEDGLQFRHALDGLQRPQHAQHSQRLDRAQVLAGRASPVLVTFPIRNLLF